MNPSASNLRTNLSWLYLMGFSILVLFRFVEVTAVYLYLRNVALTRIDYWFNLASFAACGIMLLYAALARKYKWYEALAALAALLFAARVAVISHNYYLFWTVTAIVCARGVEFDDIVWAYACVCITTLLTVVVLSRLHIIAEMAIYRGDRVRFALGTRHPNYFGGHALFIALAVAYLRRNKINLLDAAATLFLAIFCNEVPQSRAAAVMLFVLGAGMFVAFVYRCHTKGQAGCIDKWAAILMMLVPVACAVFSIVFTYRYDPSNPLHAQINTLTSGRFSGGQFALNYYPNFSVFGQRALLFPEVSPAGKISVDNFYVRCLILFGPVVLAASLAVLAIIDARAIGRKSYWPVFLIAVMAAYCICEAYLLRVEFDFFVVALLASCSTDMAGVYLPKKIGRAHREPAL